MKVQQALIMAGSRGTRLGLGTKSHIIYKNKLLLEYVIEGCVHAGIKKIVVFLPTRDIDKEISAEKWGKRKELREKYKNIHWVQYSRDRKLGFRGSMKLMKKYLEGKPFFLLTGHSPQSPKYLSQMSKTYNKGAIVLSGYNQRYESGVSVAKIKGKTATELTNIQFSKPRNFKVKGSDLITQMPYILDPKFMSDVMERDNYQKKIEFYSQDFLKIGKVYVLKNPMVVSEIDYKRDLPKLYKAISVLNKI